MNQLPKLPCPQCRLHKRTGRIGNRRNTCATCNNFVRNVERIAGKQLRERHAEEFRQLRLKAEAALYPGVIDEFEEKFLTHLRPADDLNDLESLTGVPMPPAPSHTGPIPHFTLEEDGTLIQNAPIRQPPPATSQLADTVEKLTKHMTNADLRETK